MTPFGIRREKLGEWIGSEKIAEEMIAAGWLKPLIKEKRLTLYSTEAIAKAFSRLEREGRPKVPKK